MLRTEINRVLYLPNGNRPIRSLSLVHTWSTTKTRITTSAMTSKVKGQGRKDTWSLWQLLAHESRTKSPINTKIERKVAHPTGNNAHQVQGQKVKVTTPIIAETKSVSLRLRTSNMVGGWSMRYRLSWPTIKACEIALLQRAGAYRVGCFHPTVTQLVEFHLAVIGDFM